MKKSKNLLLVEDDNLLSSLYNEVFAEYGQYHVHIESDGKGAIKAINKNNFNVIILDYFVPIYNAIQILEKTRSKTLDNPNTHIVILTNMTNEDVYQKLHELGIQNILIKTEYTPKTLLEKINQILEQ